MSTTHRQSSIQNYSVEREEEEEEAALEPAAGAREI
jgi:hypothetical protein